MSTETFDLQSFQCNLMISIANDNVFLFSMGVKVATALIGIALAAFAAYYEKLTCMIHPNARLIIRAQFFFIIVSGVAIVAINGIDFVRMVRYRSGHKDGNECDMTSLPAWVGAVFQFLLIFGNNNSTTFLMALSIERTIATLKAQSYEKLKSSNIGRILAFLALLGNIPLLGWIFGSISYDQRTVLVTATESAHAAGGHALKIMIACELLGLLIFAVLFIVNLKRRRAASRLEAPLAYKYQIQENVASFEIIFPVAFLHCMSYTVSYVILIVSVTVLSNSSADVHAITKFLSVCDFTVAYVILLPLMMIFKTFHKSKQ